MYTWIKLEPTKAKDINNQREKSQDKRGFVLVTRLYNRHILGAHMHYHNEPDCRITLLSQNSAAALSHKVPYHVPLYNECIISIMEADSHECSSFIYEISSSPGQVILSDVQGLAALCNLPTEVQSSHSLASPSVLEARIMLSHPWEEPLPAQDSLQQLDRMHE